MNSIVSNSVGMNYAERILEVEKKLLKIIVARFQT
jgi:hypothetical protein